MLKVGALRSVRPRTGRLGIRSAAFALLTLGSVAAAHAQESAPFALSGGIETETNSRYVWRGLAWSEGAVQQSSLYCTMARLTASLWMNHDLNSPDAHLGLNEVDLALSYDLSLGSFGVEPSFSHYRYPYQSDSPATDELGLLLSYDLGGLSVRSEQSLDIHSYPGAYYGDLGLACQAELSQRTSFEATVYFGWASSEFASAYAGEAPHPFRVAGVETRLYYSPAAWLYFSPHVSLSSVLPSGYGSLLGDSDVWQVGLAVGTELAP